MSIDMTASVQGTPIFIFSFNRLSVLRRAIESFMRIEPRPSIVIHDSGSTYEPLLEYLFKLEDEGAVLYMNRPRIDVKEKLNLIDNTIVDYFSSRSPCNYAVTDPDIAFSAECPANVLDLYADLLVALPDATGIGPMLRIDNLPDWYPLKNQVVRKHTEQFYSRNHSDFLWRGQKVSYQYNYIDTTFGLYRAGSRFKRASRSARVYGPYWAEHLDWYIDPANLEEDQRVYLSEASDVSHWGGTWLQQAIDANFDEAKYDFKF